MNRLAIYSRLLGFLKPYWKQTVFAYISVFGSILLNLLVPQVIKDAIDRGLSTGSLRIVLTAAGIILLLALLRGVNQFLLLYFGQWMSFRVAYDLRNAYYNKVQSLPFSFHDRAHTGDLMSRATSDIAQTERFTGEGLLNLVSTIILTVGVVVAMLLEDAPLALLALIPLPFLLLATIRFGRVVLPRFRDIQNQMGVLSTMMQESLTGIRVVKAFAREPYELEKFDVENSSWFEKRYGLIRTWANNWPTFTLLIAVSIFLLLWFGGPQALDAQITVGTLFAMISYVLLLNGPVQRLGFLVNQAATAAAAATRVFEIMDLPNETADQATALPLATVAGAVTFEKVSFAYVNGKPVLQDVSFHAEPGQTVALMGPTGAGKSTIINLLPRFYNPTGGRILIDGIDISTVQIATLRHHVGQVLQEPFLFSMTIAENIAYGRPDADREAVIAAAQAARAHEFILRFPAGYDTAVGERGVTLSGGQKQRVAIARALLTDPRILVLDDSTSSVDTETEYLIQQALATLMEGRTTFVIAQRLLTLKNADLILVLDGGGIVQRGTHAQLLAREGLYRDIYDLQLRDQEELLSAAEATQR